jgi:hypothetical protein
MKSVLPLVFLACLATGIFVYDRWPSAPEGYIVRLKDRCVPDEGASFTMNYTGSGSVRFTVVPPTETVTTTTLEAR